MATPLINFSGIASGIDSNALIDAISDASRQVKVVPHEEKVAELDDTNSALEELTTLFLEMRDLADQFTSLNGGPLAKLAASADETIVTATATNAAQNGSFGINVSQLAENATYSFDDRYSASSDLIAAGLTDTGNNFVNIYIGQGANQEHIRIEIENTTTVTEFVTQFNQQASVGTASLVNVGTEATPSYAIVLTSSETGLEKGELTVDLATEGSDITGAGAWTSSEIDQAQNATFTVSGIAGNIERASNTVTDVILGVTLNLQDTSPGASDTIIQVSDDVAATTAKVQDFLDSYNEVIAFIQENNLITRQEDGEDVENIFSPLATTSIDDNALSAIRSAIIASRYDSGDSIKIFAELGITTERDGTLKFDQETFKSAVEDEPRSVHEILQNFGDEVALTGGTIDVYTRFNGLFDITIRGNERLISDLNDRISRAEDSIAHQREVLTQRFARFEALLGGLQTQQAALSSALASLGIG